MFPRLNNKIPIFYAFAIVFAVLYGVFLWYENVLAYGNRDASIGYYCPPETETITEGGYYEFDSGAVTCHYLIDDGSWVSGKYGDTYIGTVGAATLNSGHSLGVGCNDGICDSTQTDNWGTRTQDDDLFVAIYNSSDLTNCRTYFQTGAGSCAGGEYGIITFKWGEGTPVYYDNNISLLSPVATTTDDTNVDLYIEYYNDGTFDTISWLGWYESNNFNTAFATTTQANIGITIGDTINVDLDTNSAILWRVSMESTATTTTPMYSDFGQFSVVTNPYHDLIGVEDWDETFGLATTTCSISNITGCFQNAMIYLFKPSTTSFNLIIGLKDEIKYKPPFGYFYAIQSAFELSTTTPAYTWDIPEVMSDTFAPIKTGISWLLWIIFAFWVVRTFGKLQL